MTLYLAITVTPQPVSLAVCPRYKVLDSKRASSLPVTPAFICLLTHFWSHCIRSLSRTVLANSDVGAREDGGR